MVANTSKIVNVQDTYSCLDKEHGDKLVGGRIGVLKRWTRKNE